MSSLQKLVNSLNKMASNDKQFSVDLLSAKLNKYCQAYPEDQTINSIALVVNKMSENKTSLISRGSLNDLYRRLYSRNTKFAECFQQELGEAEQLKGPTLFPRSEEEKEVENYTGDAVLANALESVFDKGIPVKMYSKDLAKKALSVVSSTLDAWNLKPCHLTVDSGNDKFLVIKATYDSPKGITSFYVPVETKNDKILNASIFMGNGGVKELNNSNLKDYLTSFTGEKLLVRADVILDVLMSSTAENKEISDTEMALIRLKTARQQGSEFAQNQIVGQKLNIESEKDVEVPKSEKFASFEKQLATAHGTATYKFGEKVVNTGRGVLVRELKQFGYRNPQVVVSDSDESNIFYNVSLDDKVAFTVPMKLVNGNIKLPSVMLCNGTAYPFTQDSVKNLSIEGKTDYKALASTSPLFDLKPSDILNNLRQAMSENNYTKAEDALNVLASCGDQKAYATGFQLFLSGLGGKTEVESKCSFPVKNASSKHLLCSHTGLPVNKVYQDQHGNCRPLYRRNMSETYEGASFMNSKIFG